MRGPAIAWRLHLSPFSLAFKPKNRIVDNPCTAALRQRDVELAIAFLLHRGSGPPPRLAACRSFIRYGQVPNGDRTTCRRARGFGDGASGAARCPRIFSLPLIHASQ